MNRLLLVDGNNLLFQMFFGMPARIVDENGRPIQGVLGFVGALLKMIRHVQPTHVAVLFDGECENARKAEDEAYKANRTDYSEVADEESPFSQLPSIYKALDVLHIPHRETENCEADDWIAGYALRYGKTTEIVIASFDSDFFQLIDEHVRVFRYHGEHSLLWTVDTVREKFGVLPNRYADYKALVGDTADNIKGAEKVGKKTAAALLATYGSLDGVLQKAEEIEKASVRASILRDRERLARNYRLIKLQDTAQLPFSLEELVFCDDGWRTKEVLRKAGVSYGGDHRV